MKRRQFTSGGVWGGAVWLAGPALWVCDPARAQGFSDADATQGIRAALERGAVAAVGLLGQTDGFMGNPKVRIPLPGFLNDAAKLLKLAGQQQKVDELVLAMNRAAEQAVPQAKTLLVQAAKTISVQDAVKIVRGSDTSVTEFFADKTRVPLFDKFLPVVARATEKVALADKFNAVAGKAAKMGLLKAEDSNIQHYVTGKSLDGLFLMIGEQERGIRRDPVGTGSAILKKVFGG